MVEKCEAVDELRPARRADDRSELCVVSHRLPATYHPDLGWQRSPGGLVSAVEPALRGASAKWFGRVSHGAPTPPSGPRQDLFALPVSQHAERNAVEGFCHRTLWPALHGLAGNVEQLDDWWQSYRNLSNRTAKLLATQAPVGATVWLHDYHFFAVPGRLKQLRPDLRVGVFCHTPVDASTLGSIAMSDELASSLRASDFIGVQTRSDAGGVQSLFLRDQVTEIERRINVAHLRGDGLPVVDIIDEQRSPREVAALYRAADLAIVTPVRDGLNLVAVEYSVINQDRECELILGVGAGAHQTIGSSCISVDGDDVMAIAGSIRAAMAEDPRRRETASRCGATVLGLDSADWFRRCSEYFAESTTVDP